MTQLPFEDLPEKPERYTDADLCREFDETFWPNAWARGTPAVKGERLGALREYKRAVRNGDSPKFLGDALAFAGIGMRDIDPQYRPSVRKWLHNGCQHDEYDTPVKYNPPKTDYQLQQIATQVNSDWYEFGKWPRDVLQQCVDAGLLTVERMEEKS